MDYAPEEKEFSIENITYRKKKLLASKHWELACELMKLTGGAFNGVGVDTDLNIGMCITGLMQNATPEVTSKFMEKWIRECIVQPNMNKDNYELHFGKYFHHSFEVFGEILSQNFGKAIEELKKKLSRSEMFTMALAMILKPQKEKNEQEQNSGQSKSTSANTNT